MKRKAALSRNRFALLLAICFGAMLSGCITVDCGGGDCSKCGGGEGCFSHNPPTPADVTQYSCTQGNVCDPGGTCPRGKKCKTTTSSSGGVTTCACGCQTI
jgi:hypothetical protein